MNKHVNKIEKLIAELCPEGVEYKTLGEIISLEYGKPLKENNRSGGDFPVLGSNGRVGFHNSFLVQGPCLIVGRKGSAGVLVWEEKNCYPIDTTFYVKIHYEQLSLKYLFHKLSTLELTDRKQDGGVPGINRNNVYKISIPVPPLLVQEEIVKILDTFTTLEAELEAELEARKKQYEYYRAELLSFVDDVEWKTLGEVAEIGTGSSNTNEEIVDGLYPFFVRSPIVRFKNTFEFDETAIITSGDGVGVGKIFHFVEGKYALHQRAYRIHIIEHRISPKFFFFYMRNTFEKFILSNAVNSSVTSVRRPMLNKYPVPILPLVEQDRIVAILDKFDALVNDISVGLPAELNARRKQYEYYRNKLLTFKELNSPPLEGCQPKADGVVGVVL